MPYSQALAERIRNLLGKRKDIVEKKMFGGVGFLLNGNLVVCVWQSKLIARIGADEYEAFLALPHVRKFDVTGKPMKGWVMVEPDGIENDRQLGKWIRQACEFVETLPSK